MNPRPTRSGCLLPWCLAAIFITNVFPVLAAPPYEERWRPQFHFTPPKNWMNDPNGLVFYEGEFHLFYQHNPFEDQWGHMSWGHAVSRDLLRWKHLPLALAEKNNVMIFSGSAVVDWRNTSKFSTTGKPPLVAFYTGHHTDRKLETQNLAYSNDRGRTWTKFAGNPVLDIGEADFRDPKVFWHEPTKRWIMAVAWPQPRKIRFYASPNLKTWKHLSDFGPAGGTLGVWECPDLFELPVEKGNGRDRWVLIVNTSAGAPAGGWGCQYFVGNFNGTNFTLDASYPKPQEEFIPEGRLLADFEGTNYGGWQATGDAFGEAPARGKWEGQQPVSGYRGQGFVNSFREGDSTSGTLTSPPFTLDRRYLNFLIGGGYHPGETALNLIVSNAIVCTATGNDSERLTWKAWDVRAFKGATAKLEIVDRNTANWGHVNVDQIFLADSPARSTNDAALWADWGRDFYAAVSWSDIPRFDGRRLWLGWMTSGHYSGDVPTSPWRGALTIPRSLTLRQTLEGPRLFQEPVRELERLRSRHDAERNCSVAEANAWLAKEPPFAQQLEIEAEWLVSTNTAEFGFTLQTGTNEATRLIVDLAQQQFRLDRTRSGRTDFHPNFPGVHAAPIRAVDGKVRLHVFLDSSSIEVFVNDGEAVVTDLLFPTPGKRRLQCFASAGATPPKIKSFDVWELKSIW